MDRALLAHLREQGITDERVLDAMARVPRARFLPPEVRAQAGADVPLPIGYGQTISQPYVVALMTSALDVAAGARVLEIGTGSGYQAAVLAALGADVWSIEIVPELHLRAEATLGALGLEVHLRLGDGTLGWPEAAPFERVLATASPRVIPPALFAGLAEGGRLLTPVGGSEQVLQLWTRSDGALHVRQILPVRFVPFTGAGA